MKIDTSIGARVRHPGREVVLIVDPTIGPTSPLLSRLNEEGFHVCLAETVEHARRHLLERQVDFVMTELHLRDGDAIDVIRLVRNRSASSRVIVHSKYCDLANTVSVTKAGASDVLPKPADLDFLIAILVDRSLTIENYGMFVGSPVQLRADYILQVYESCGGCTTQAARNLSMHRRTLQRFLERTGSGGASRRAPLRLTGTT